jgi:hypothetical protein
VFSVVSDTVADDAVASEVGHAVEAVGAVGADEAAAVGVVAVADVVSSGRGVCALKALLGTNDPFEAVETFGVCGLVSTDMERLSTRKIAPFTGVCLVIRRNRSIDLTDRTPSLVIPSKRRLIPRFLQRFA